METEKTSKKSGVGKFFLGLGIGLGVMLVIGLIAVLLVVNFFVRRVNTLYTLQTSADSEGILDEATIKKINLILTTFDNKSILDLDDEAIRRGIIDGAIKGTGDKYAMYYTPEEIKEVMTGYGGTFYGIGATIALNDKGYPEVQQTIGSSPAEVAGVRAGDIITKIDGESVAGLNINEVVSKIHGDRYTDVVLTIYRDGEDDYIDIVVTRDEIIDIVVSHEMEEGNIGYIHIQKWYETTPAQFREALDDLKGQGMKGLVVDLRSNTGGLLEAVVGVCREVLPAGKIVLTENVEGLGSTYDCDGKNELGMPIVVLTNAYTASASEIFTGAVKDNGAGISMGTTTYGKGVVQSFSYFSDGSAIKLTTEQYFTPNGTAIDGIGITPDIEVPFDPDLYYDEGIDNQLEEALEYLYEELGIDVASLAS